MLAVEPLLRRLLDAKLPAAATFFERAHKDLQGAPGVGFRALFASVPRRLGAGAELAGAAPPELAAARPHWTLIDYARLWLVLSALPSVAAGEQPGWLLQLFEAGELGEQVSILRVLGALPDAGRFVETGVQACRHNSLDVFEAIVCENPFLAEHFPALSFNQAVMKAIFNGVSVRRIEGLERRITLELSRMAKGYASERRAAGRPVPADADYLSEYGASAGVAE
jgi:hypothetical protein